MGNLARHEDPNLLGARVVGPAVEIKIVDTESGDEILRPNRPATISLPFDPELFGPGTQRGDVFIGLLDRASGRWTPLKNCHLDKDDPKVICTSSQVGTVFGVFANTGMWRDIDANTRYFAATNTYIRGDFLRFYDETGGLDRHGFPRTNAGPENGVTTQWFQRSRFEASSDVRLAFLGDEFVRALGLGWDLDTSQECEIRNSPPPMVGSLAGPEPLGSLVGIVADELLRSLLLIREDQPLTGVVPHRYFPERAFCLAGSALKFFDPGRGESSFGNPISPEFTDDSIGGTVQYFERARFEFRLNEAGGTRIVLGLLGDDLLRLQGRLP